jgi:hypothetical protein
MKIRALIIAAALSGGAAFAATPGDTAKASNDTDAKPAMAKSMAGEHRKTHRKHHHAMRHGMRHHHEDMASSAPSTDVNDQGRQARMDEALANYRKQHG